MATVFPVDREPRKRHCTPAGREQPGSFFLSISRTVATLPGLPVFLAILVIIVPDVPAQTPIPPRPYDGGITLDIWTTEDRIIHGEESTPERRLLEEARYTLSGLIYGWDFSYTPRDPQRQVSERFDLAPISQVPWGSPGLRVRDLRALEGTLYGQIDYTFSPNEIAHLSQWNSFATARSSGTGNGPLLDGAGGKIRAIENGIHQAVREYLRGRFPNRPREVTGAVALARPPRVRTVSGEYEATVTVVIDIRDVRDYLTF